MSYDDFEELMQDNLEGFKVIYDGIPKPSTLEELEDYNPSDYIDDHGTETRDFIFEDLLTNKKHQLIYQLSPEYGFNIRTDSLLHNEILELYEPERKPKPKKVEVLTSEQEEIKKLKDEYESKSEEFEFSTMPLRGKQELIPQFEIDTIKNFMKKEKFSINDLVKVFYPIAIKYKVDQKSLWQYYQREYGSWL